MFSKGGIGRHSPSPAAMFGGVDITSRFIPTLTSHKHVWLGKPKPAIKEAAHWGGHEGVQESYGALRLRPGEHAMELSVIVAVHVVVQFKVEGLPASAHAFRHCRVRRDIRTGEAGLETPEVAEVHVGINIVVKGVRALHGRRDEARRLPRL